MRDILFENSKKDYTKSLIELLRLEGKKISARRLLLRKQHFYTYLKIGMKGKKTKRNVQNTNSILSDLS
jgi:hypothetical protein